MNSLVKTMKSYASARKCRKIVPDYVLKYGDGDENLKQYHQFRKVAEKAFEDGDTHSELIHWEGALQNLSNSSLARSQLVRVLCEYENIDEAKRLLGGHWTKPLMWLSATQQVVNKINEPKQKRFLSRLWENSAEQKHKDDQRRISNIENLCLDLIESKSPNASTFVWKFCFSKVPDEKVLSYLDALCPSSSPTEFRAAVALFAAKQDRKDIALRWIDGLTSEDFKDLPPKPNIDYAEARFAIVVLKNDGKAFCKLLQGGYQLSFPAESFSFTDIAGFVKKNGAMLAEDDVLSDFCAIILTKLSQFDEIDIAYFQMLADAAYKYDDSGSTNALCDYVRSFKIDKRIELLLSLSKFKRYDKFIDMFIQSSDADFKASFLIFFASQERKDLAVKWMRKLTSDDLKGLSAEPHKDLGTALFTYVILKNDGDAFYDLLCDGCQLSFPYKYFSLEEISFFVKENESALIENGIFSNFCVMILDKLSQFSQVNMEFFQMLADTAYQYDDSNSIGALFDYVDSRHVSMKLNLLHFLSNFKRCDRFEKAVAQCSGEQISREQEFLLGVTLQRAGLATEAQEAFYATLSREKSDDVIKAIERNLQSDQNFVQTLQGGDDSKVAKYLSDKTSHMLDTNNYMVSRVCALDEISNQDDGSSQIVQKDDGMINSVPPKYFKETSTYLPEARSFPALSRSTVSNAFLFGGSGAVFHEGQAWVPRMEWGDKERWDFYDPPILAWAGQYTFSKKPKHDLHFENAVTWMLSSEPNYFHYLFEGFSRFMSMLDWEPEKGTVILVDQHVIEIPQFREMIDKINDWNLPIIGVQPGQWVNVDKLTVASFAAASVVNLTQDNEVRSRDIMILPEAVQAIRQKFLPVSSDAAPSRRLYITRESAKNRRITNDEEISEFLVSRYGFIRFDPTKYSFEDQVKYFSEAEVVVGPSGAGLTNAMFMEKSTSVFPLMVERFDFSAWSAIGEVVGVDVCHIEGLSTSNRSLYRAHREYEVDLATLNEALKTKISDGRH